MKLGKLAAVGAAAAALLMAGSASATTFIANSSNTSGGSKLSGSTTLEVSTVSNTEFTFDITNPTAGWSGAVGLGAFAFNTNSIGTSGTITASETSPGSQAGTFMAGGLNSGGCDGSGAFFCFSFAPTVAVASEMDFDIKTTGTFDLSTTNLPDLKIEFVNSAGKKVESLFSADIPLCTTACPVPTTNGGGGVPEPATWAMMLVGVGMVGGAMRMRRKVATATA